MLFTLFVPSCFYPIKKIYNSKTGQIKEPDHGKTPATAMYATLVVSEHCVPLTQKSHMNEEELIKSILDEAFHIHKTIGPGMLESVYKTCLAYRLRKRELF